MLHNFSDSSGKPNGEASAPTRREPGQPLWALVLGRAVLAVQTAHGLRAMRNDQPIDPEGVRRYLTQKFGQNLAEVRTAMEALAQAYPPDQLAAQAYALYERFRPAIPEGKQGWGAAGELDLQALRVLARPGESTR